ncbi:tol-pal system-associated acyl-CoA thioesterase [Dongshaea marina]|uniref:tol-pal system-associated acyl-CoA thioesterase n=1 Tax=Dongshaea marina TaxID=2047966 RepID=UPI001F02D6EA|nr:tol-pal system-associated acyl-CoA thioesterase [Dongshaea marina]
MMQAVRHQCQFRVYYAHTDAGGWVYHANYLNFLEQARTDFLRDQGITQADIIRNNDLVFAVRRCELDYLGSAYLDELITVSSEVIELKRASVVFKQQIHNEQGSLLCEALIRLACVNIKTGKPAAFPKEIKEVLEGAN